MEESWQAKLRRLGVKKGARDLKPARPVDDARRRRPAGGERPDVAGDPQPLETLLPGGEVVDTAVSACFVLDQVYPLTHRHGDDRLADLLELPPRETAVYLGDERLADLDYRDFVFLDTETTGLAGAGTLAFMVGAAFFEDDALVTRQYFLRDHGDEPAMLQLLDDLLAKKGGLVTFNGRTFDLPLLDGRYLMNRMPGAVLDLPHIDLLPPARRLWRDRVGSCALSSLEQNLLQVQRTHEDVPGWAIPGLYHDYLRSGDARELLRVFYHNEIDLLSMVTLAARVTRLVSQPEAGDHAIDRYSLGRWQARLGMAAVAEVNLRAAAEEDLPLELYHKALYELGWLLKRNGRRAEAVPYWQQIAATTFDDITAHVELAKFYEWHEPDLATALSWTDQALQLVGGWSRGQALAVEDELTHRRDRLLRKLNVKNED